MNQVSTLMLVGSEVKSSLEDAESVGWDSYDVRLGLDDETKSEVDDASKSIVDHKSVISEMTERIHFLEATVFGYSKRHLFKLSIPVR